jgi:RNA polymerase sigma-70 factor (ECF subfamily)
VNVEHLYGQHAPSLHRYLVRYTGDADLAADAVHEAFARLLEHRPAERELRGWLFTVATNYVRGRATARSRHARLLAAAPQGALHGDAPADPEARVLGAERHQRVQAALARLPDRDRTVLLMREEGFTHAEIAAAVGTTTKSVGTITARALVKLAAALGPNAKELR